MRTCWWSEAGMILLDVQAAAQKHADRLLPL